MKTLRVFEAFAGYGSQHLALNRLRREHPDFNFEVVGISEIDKYAIAAYAAVHGSEIPNFGDITKINWGGGQIPDFDLFTYSFPCQDISNAGKQRGFTEGSGTRSSLLWCCAEAIRIKRPKYLLMENVKALLQKKFKDEFAKWQHYLEDMGYSNFTQVLNSKNYGVPQNRERVFMVSILDCRNLFHFPQPFPLERRLRHVLEQNVDESYYLSEEQVQKIIAHCARKQAEGCGFKTNFQTPDGIAGAIKTKEGSREYDTYIKEELPPPAKEPTDRIIQVNKGSADQAYGECGRTQYRVYDPDGIAPCLHTCGGGNLEPKIIEPIEDEETRRDDGTGDDTRCAGRVD